MQNCRHLIIAIISGLLRVAGVIFKPPAASPVTNKHSTNYSVSPYLSRNGLEVKYSGFIRWKPHESIFDRFSYITQAEFGLIKISKSSGLKKSKNLGQNTIGGGVTRTHEA